MSFNKGECVHAHPPLKKGVGANKF